jgi:hypothetical protein
MFEFGGEKELLAERPIAQSVIWGMETRTLLSYPKGFYAASVPLALSRHHPLLFSEAAREQFLCTCFRAVH